MKPLQDQIAQYASYHRDTRNIATHFVGIPMIVLAIVTLLSRPAFDVAGLPVTAALVAAVAAGIYYLRLDARLGIVMSALLALTLVFGHWIAGMATPVWIAVGVALFVVGWIFQFIGHAWEGRKPAFVDDLMGLIIGPLFVVVEASFALGLLRELRRQVEDRVGPSRVGGRSAVQ